MARSRSVTFWLSALMALSLVLAGCGSGSEEPSGGDSEGSEAPTDAAASEDGGLVLEGEQIADAELLAAAQEEGRLVLYTAQNEEGETRLGQVFTEDTGVEVEVVRLPGARLHERILSEHGAGQLGGDVVHQSDFETNLEYHELGIITAHELPSDLDEALDDKWKHPENAFYQTLISTYGIVYNTQVVTEDEAPKAWEDLLDPKWGDGKILMTFAGIGGSGWSIAQFQRKELGEDYWSKLAAQSPTIGQSASSIVEEIARGEYPIGVNSILTTTNAIKDGAPMNVVFPEEGTPGTAYALSLLDGPNPNAGALYMNWRNSKRGLTAAADELGAWAAREDVPPPADGHGGRYPALDEMKLWTADPEEWVSLRDEWVAEWNQVFNYSPQ